jgi:ACS family allantoate permease-like MFS transporter
MLFLRWMMNRENKRRDSEPRNTTYDEVYVERENDDGTTEKIRVDKVGITMILDRLVWLLISC